MKKNWIQNAIKKPWALREALWIKAWETIPPSKLKTASNKPWKLWARARLAITLSKLRKKKNG